MAQEWDLRLWPSSLGCRWMHLFGLMPQSHFTWADRDLRMVLQCAHCDTGRPFLLICCNGRSGEVALVSSTFSQNRNSAPGGLSGGRRRQQALIIYIPECWQLLTRCPRTQASQAYFSPSISILIPRMG